MTIYELDHVIEMVDECRDSHNPVREVWEYENTMNHKTMFAVFTMVCHNDLLESPAVDKQVLIYCRDEWYKEYAYLNG